MREHIKLSKLSPTSFHALMVETMCDFYRATPTEDVDMLSPEGRDEILRDACADVEECLTTVTLPQEPILKLAATAAIMSAAQDREIIYPLLAMFDKEGKPRQDLSPEDHKKVRDFREWVCGK